MSTYVRYSSGGPDLLPLPYLSVTKHLLTPRRNHFQWSCSSQSRINCSNSNQYVSFPSWQVTNVHSFTLPVSRLFLLAVAVFLFIMCWLLLCSGAAARSLVSFFHPQTPSDQYAASWIHWIQIHHGSFVQHQQGNNTQSEGTNNIVHRFYDKWVL